MPPKMPSQRELMWPTLLAFREAGGTLSNEESVRHVVDQIGMPEELQAVPHRRTTKIAHRVAWARTHLKACGLLDNPARSVWSVTPAGAAAKNEAEVIERHNAAVRGRRHVTEDAEEPDGTSDGWQSELLQVLMGMPPEAFERLAGRLLRQAGFVNVEVSGRTGDGGLDGVGVYRLSLVSFHVFFQCKRYQGTVGAGAVRDFRGAMAGRGEKGLLITTGGFTREAEREAERDGAPPVELVDGARLCTLLREHKVGVSVKERVVEDVLVDAEYFASL